MGYFLGVDIGTTYTAAAVWRDGRCDVASLGNRAPTIPSVVFLRDDGTVLIGEAAARRAASEPASVAREFKRRVGDPTPVIVGGTPYSADALMARLLRAVVDLVVEAEGSAPDGVAVTHPANWGPYKLDLFHQATRLADLDDVVTVSEPEAAAIHYASQSRVEPGAVIAVYDLGGGTFDAAVLRKTDAGWDVLGTPEGIERLGGVDFDAAVHHHVASAISPALDDLSPDDPAALAAAARLRQECVDAKEALSADSDVSIPVLLPKLQTEVRLTRAEYEQMVRPALADSITSLTRALRSAGVEPGDVTTVLLVGGSSRTPLVAELVSSALGRPVAVDAHPKYGVALGAAITAAVAGGRRSAGDHTSVTTPPVEVPPAPAMPAAGLSAVAPAVVAGAAAGVAGAAAAATTTGPARGGDQVAASAATSGAPAAAAPAAPTRISTPPVQPTATPPTQGPGPTQVSASSPSSPSSPARTEPVGPARPTPAGADPRRDPRSVMVPYGSDQLPPASPRPGRGAGNGDPPAGQPSSRPSRRPLLLAVGALAVVAIAVGAVLALGGGDEDPSGDDASAAGAGSPESGEAPNTTAPTTTDPPAPAGPFVQIDSVELDGGQYLVNYQVIGYVPQLDGGPDSLHVHFFPNTQPPETAGTNGPPDTSDWDVTDESASFRTKYTPASVGEATQMCSAVANVDHSVHQPETRTGNCFDLPA